MDSFFKQRFNAAKCKTLLKLTIPRIKLLRNRKEIQLKQMRRDIAKLLQTGQEATARIRVEHIIREEKMMAAQEIVELFCELISVRLPIIEAQRECPLDLKEAISSICFAAPRCADLLELMQAQMLFAGKYGKEFVSAATELMPECGVNRQLIELLSIRAPAPEVKLKLLKEIAEEHEFDWDPSISENELLKPHEDLLNVPTHFVSGSKFPLPEEKVADMTTTPEPATQQYSDSDEDFDMVDFPEVPKQPLQSNKGTVSAPEMLPFPSSAFSEIDDQEELNPSELNENISELEHKKSVTMEDALSKISTDHVEVKQSAAFIPPPLQSPQSLSTRENNNSPSFNSKTNYISNVDLQDILAAAQSAAESAEHAALATRSAANIAQLRIRELVNNNNGVSGSTVEDPYCISKSKLNVEEKGELDEQNSYGDFDNNPLTSSSQNNDHIYSMEDTRGNGISHHQPQRLPSMDDETYLSYPNLFTSQGSNLSRTDSK